MKILLVTDSLTSGGKERRLTELMKKLKIRPDIDFELAVMDQDIHYKEVFDLGIQIHYIIRNRKKDLFVFYRFYKLFKQYKPDIVHCWDSMTAVYLMPACILLNIRVVNGMVIDTPVKHNILNKNWVRAKLTFPFSYRVIGNSQAGLTAYNAPKKRSVCIYNGFNFDRIKSIENPGIIRAKFNIKSKYIVLMVGSFADRKDYDSYIEAAMIVSAKRNDTEFIAVGDGENMVRISEKIYKCGNQNIKLVGKQTDVESIINTSDICVLTTNAKVHGEGISNSILEYMALGKPVIASTGGGTNEIVKEGETGFLIGPSSPEELTEKIEQLLNDAELRSKMGLAGKERIKKYFSIDSMINKYISVYQKQ